LHLAKSVFLFIFIEGFFRQPETPIIIFGFNACVHIIALA